MQYNRVGRSGLKVSKLSLGSWLTYGGSTEKTEAIRAVQTAYEFGVNSFDTANEYGQGEAERVLGEALKSFSRESYVVATKAFSPMGEGPNDRGLSRKHVIEQVNASLRRLNMDYVDIFYCHRFDTETPVEETLRAIDDLIRRGKILYAGVSRWTGVQIREALKIADRYLLDRIVVGQHTYNLLNREIEEEVLTVCIEEGLGQIVFSPLAQGVLSGKYKHGEPVPKGSRADNPMSSGYIERYMKREFLERVQSLTKFADELGVSMPQLALAWVINQPGITSAIIGASRAEQVRENLSALEVRVTDEVKGEIERIMKG